MGEFLAVDNWQLIVGSLLAFISLPLSSKAQIIDSNYYGDGRDVIMEAMGTPGNTNDHGMTPFKGDKE